MLARPGKRTWLGIIKNGEINLRTGPQGFAERIGRERERGTEFKTERQTGQERNWVTLEAAPSLGILASPKRASVLTRDR